MSNNSDCPVFAELASAGQLWASDHVDKYTSERYCYRVLGVREDGLTALSSEPGGAITTCDATGQITGSSARLLWPADEERNDD